MFNGIIGDRKGDKVISDLKKKVTKHMSDTIDNVMMNLIEEKFGQLRTDVCKSVARDSFFILDTIVQSKMEDLKGEVFASVATNQEFINRVANSISKVQVAKNGSKRMRDD